MKIFNNRKGNTSAFNTLAGLAVGVVFLLIVLSVGFLVMSQTQTQIGTTESIDITNATQCQTSAACNATTTLTNAAGTIPGWVPLIIIVVIGGALLSLLAIFRRS